MRQHLVKLALLAIPTAIIVGLLAIHPQLLARFNRSVALEPGLSFSAEAVEAAAQRYGLSGLQSSSIYELLVSGKQPGSWPQSASLNVKLDLPGGRAVRKALNTGDPDMYLMFQPASAGAAWPGTVTAV